jgi:hypothetical protein
MTEQVTVASSTEEGYVDTPRVRGIQTYTGLHFTLEDPVFRIEDIAHGLSNVCRFAGQSRHFYSVAEHSVIVSLLMEELKLGDPGEGLFHDATEAYLADIPSPWKHHYLPDYRKIEADLERTLRDNFYMPTAKTYGCRQADTLAFLIEAWFLLPDRGASCGVDQTELKSIATRLIDSGWRTLNLLPTEAKAAFLARYEALQP